VGSGAAAAGAAIALSSRGDQKITVIDIGLRIEQERAELVSALASSSPDRWQAQEIEGIAQEPARSVRGIVPEKRIFGSDFPFRDAGQLGGVTALGSTTTAIISAAYGGFSNVWGSQVMPFTAAAFDSWPVSAETMRYHYASVLREIPFAGEEDDLAINFPLLHAPVPLPQMSPRTARVLGRYDSNRSVLNRLGVTVGKARLAFSPTGCVRCALCMKGCPYGLIYSASQTFDDLLRTDKVALQRGYLAIKISEENSQAVVTAIEIASGHQERFSADRVYLACGAVGTTRLVANSLGLYDTDISIMESQQFVLPMLSMSATEDPRGSRDFTLNQFNVVVAPDHDPVNISMLHCYAFNPAFIGSLPAMLRAKHLERFQVQLIRRLSVAFGYLPSWNSPRLRIHIGPAPGRRELPTVEVSRDRPPASQRLMLQSVLARLARSSRLLDLYPVLPMLRLSAGGKSYHWGGSFPHADGTRSSLTSDRWGRVGSWTRVHLVDGAVLPNVPAMTYGLTLMANAHRIAAESLELS